MADIKREDITLSDWTKGISADEFAWGSYFYSEAISTGYSTKGFELWYRLGKNKINSRPQWYATSLSPSHNYWFMATTRDGRIECQYTWNWSSYWDWDTDGGGALYSYYEWSWVGTGYLNWVTYWDYIFWIRDTRVEKIKVDEVFDPSAEMLWETDMSVATWWTIGTWWTITDNWAEHTAGETADLSYDLSWESMPASENYRVAIKISNCTAGYIEASLWNTGFQWESGVNGWVVYNLRWYTTPILTLTPSSSFNWTIEKVNVHHYDGDKITSIGIYWWTYSNKHPALVWEWDLYVASRDYVNIINLWDDGVTYKRLIDANFTIVSMTQQAWNIILWATDGYNSRQYYWNWVDAVATEVIEWKGLIIQWVTWTETLSYVLTTSWANSWSVEWYEYRLYAVSWYQRNLIASKLFQFRSDSYLDGQHYNLNKKFDFNDVTSDQSMIIFLDSLFIPWCDGIYKYWSDIAGLRSAWSRPIRYDTWAKHIIMWQRWNFVWVAFRVWNDNYIWEVDNRLYPSTWFIVTESIYWDKLSTRKAIEKIKIWYKNVASTVGNIKVYAIVDDTYFWRFRPTSTPTTRPTVWAVYNVANNTTASVIDVDTTNGVITFKTESNMWSYIWLANTTLTKVSGTGDDSIAVWYNYDNMCLIKTIESATQWYGADFIFWKDFVNSYMPYWYKIQFVIELNSNDKFLSPEVYELSIHSDITDTIL